MVFETCVFYFDGQSYPVIPTTLMSSTTDYGTVTYDAPDRFGITRVMNCSASGTNYASKVLLSAVTCKTVVMWINPLTITSSTSLSYSSVDLLNVDSTTTFSSNMTTPSKYINGVSGNTFTANTWQMIAATSSTGTSVTTLQINHGTNVGLNGYIGEVFLFSDVKTTEFLSALYYTTKNKYIYPYCNGERNLYDT